jgi:hypothetical protein
MVSFMQIWLLLSWLGSGFKTNCQSLSWSQKNCFSNCIFFLMACCFFSLMDVLFNCQMMNLLIDLKMFFFIIFRDRNDYFVYQFLCYFPESCLKLHFLWTLRAILFEMFHLKMWKTKYEVRRPGKKLCEGDVNFF